MQGFNPRLFFSTSCFFENRWHLQWFRIYPIFKCHMFLLFRSGLSNQRKMPWELGFLHDEQTTLSHATREIISHCKCPAARVSVSTLLVQRFLPALDKEQPASGGADSAEHLNFDTTKLAVIKFKLKLYTMAWSLVRGVAGNRSIFHYQTEYDENVPYVAWFSFWYFLPYISYFDKVAAPPEQEKQWKMESGTDMLIRFVVSYTANSWDKVSLTLQVTASSVCPYFHPSAQEPVVIMESQLAKSELELLNPAREIRPSFGPW